MKIDYSKAKVGDVVYSVLVGKGIIFEINMNLDYPIRVDFDNGEQEAFTLEGMVFEDNLIASIYPFPVEVVRIKQKIKKYKALLKDLNNEIRISKHFYSNKNEAIEAAGEFFVQLLETQFIEVEE